MKILFFHLKLFELFEDYWLLQHKSRGKSWIIMDEDHVIPWTTFRSKCYWTLNVSVPKKNLHDCLITLENQFSSFSLLQRLHMHLEYVLRQALHQLGRILPIFLQFIYTAVTWRSPNLLCQRFSLSLPWQLKSICCYKSQIFSLDWTSYFTTRADLDINQ